MVKIYFIYVCNNICVSYYFFLNEDCKNQHLIFAIISTKPKTFRREFDTIILKLIIKIKLEMMGDLFYV